MSPDPADATGNIPTWTLGDRMRLSMRSADLGNTEIAAFLEVSPGTVSAWINNRREPNTQTLRLWAIKCRVDYDWLTEGTARDCHAGQ